LLAVGRSRAGTVWRICAQQPSLGPLSAGAKNRRSGAVAKPTVI